MPTEPDGAGGAAGGSTQVPGVQVQRSAERFVTRGPGTVSRHCFSFGEHYDPANVAYAGLVALNDVTLAPGAGFTAHPHAGVDIVTWIVEGCVEHSDSGGRVALSGPGVVQVLAAGTGITHAERNRGDGVCRFVQSWLAADGSEPASYQQLDVTALLAGGGVVPLLERKAARLYVGALGPDEVADLPAEPLLHLHVVDGSVDVVGVSALEQGDSARLTFSGQLTVITGERGAQLLIWGMDTIGKVLIA